MQVIGIKPDQVAAGGDRPAAGLGTGAVRILPGNDADLPPGRGDILMPPAQRLAGPTAADTETGSWWARGSGP